VNQALTAGASRIAVIGAGAVGLATARLVQEHGLAAIIYAKDLPPNTTSNIAGGQWSPYSVYDEACATPAFMTQFLDAARFSYRRFQLMVGDYYKIRWLPNYLMDHKPFEDADLDGKKSPIADLLPELRDLAPQEHPFPFRYVRRFDTMYIEPSVYLEAMLREFRIARGTVVVKEMNDLRDVLAIPERVIVNCTGLGAKALFNDPELTPIKGQLTVLLPQPEVDYSTEPPDDLYMFPRSDGILLGGTHEKGNWSLAPDRKAEARILAGHAAVFRDIRG
jgi:glycine/D-amino acid oxidase-like deaminating enzyme